MDAVEGHLLPHRIRHSSITAEVPPGKFTQNLFLEQIAIKYRLEREQQEILLEKFGTGKSALASLLRSINSHEDLDSR